MKEYRWFYEIFRWPLTLITYLVERLHVEGVDRIPAKGPVILVSNHLAWMDILTVAVPVRRHEHHMAKSELFQVPVLGGIIRLLGAFPVRRGESDRESLRQAQEVLSAGQVLVIFPEGHRSDTHQMAAGLPGVALIAMRSGAPIVPIGITGTEHTLKGWRIGPWAPRVRIVYGEPFTLESGGRRTREDLARGIDTIMRRIAALLPPEYRGIYGELAAVTVPADAEPSGALASATVPEAVDADDEDASSLGA